MRTASPLQIWAAATIAIAASAISATPSHALQMRSIATFESPAMARPATETSCRAAVLSPNMVIELGFGRPQLTVETSWGGAETLAADYGRLLVSGPCLGAGAPWNS